MTPRTPSTLDLEAFGVRYSREEWRVLCRNREFTDKLMEQGPAAVIRLAGEILRTNENDPNQPRR